jgi:hypothetical protein
MKTAFPSLPPCRPINQYCVSAYEIHPFPQVEYISGERKGTCKWRGEDYAQAAEQET